MPSSLLRRSVVGSYALGLLAASIATASITTASITTARGAAPPAKLTPAESVKVWQAVKKELLAAPGDERTVKQAIAAAKQLESDPATSKQAIQAYRDLSTVLGRSNDPDTVAAGRKFAGVARRLGLVGHPMKIFGDLPDGTPLDTSPLQGKVVLVDFWATWCGPCRKELPNVKRNYEKYHSRGFEVVGVSLDTDGDALQSFLGKEQIPWPVLMGQESTGAGWDSPLAVYYGVQSVPTAILVDQHGIVVSLHARGTELTERLEQLLGK